jgi:hypothetical protein
MYIQKEATRGYTEWIMNHVSNSAIRRIEKINLYCTQTQQNCLKIYIL